jgi:hypothetical protein
MKKIISSQKKSLKGFITQSVKSSTKKASGKKTISKLSMPVKFIKGEQNPVKLKKGKNTGLAMLQRACNQK